MARAAALGVVLLSNAVPVVGKITKQVWRVGRNEEGFISNSCCVVPLGVASIRLNDERSCSPIWLRTERGFVCAMTIRLARYTD